MNKFSISLFLLTLFITSTSWSQDKAERIMELKIQIEENRKNFEQLKTKIGHLKLEYYKEKYKTEIGLPSNEFVEHKAMFLQYAEEHEQPAWVAHVILPDIEDIGKGRTNDFREDSMIITGTAIEKDYFLKKLLPDSTYEYDGYGWDRGHLAPSADFRWSEEAVSESYYYSNMSPMVPEFNREIWADLEDMLRRYVLSNKVPLYVLTAPILTDDLPVIERSTNGISIPEEFIKIVLDLENNRTIGFIMRNEKAESPLDAYATTVDFVEQITGFNFFPFIDEVLESSIDKEKWFENDQSAYVKPIAPDKLKSGYLNTVFAARKKGSHRKVKVCGTVVSSRYSRSGNGWLNLDLSYPDDHFSIMIKKESLKHFDFDPIVELLNTKQCFEGEVINVGKKPIIILKKQNQLIDFERAEEF